jgi:hypothetical protein
MESASADVSVDVTVSNNGEDFSTTAAPFRISQRLRSVYLAHPLAVSDDRDVVLTVSGRKHTLTPLLRRCCTMHGHTHAHARTHMHTH